MRRREGDHNKDKEKKPNKTKQKKRTAAKLSIDRLRVGNKTPDWTPGREEKRKKKQLALCSANSQIVLKEK